MAENATTYLLRLSDALADVPRDVRTEIVAGVREELDGLSEKDAAARIRELGDPEFIAAAAREEIPPRPSENRALSVTAGILVMIGGAVVPFLGWVAGIVMMWMSRLWTRRQKWIATLAPVAGSLVIGIFVTAILYIRTATAMAGYDANPLLPATYDLLHILFIVPLFTALPIAFVTGIWLLAKAAKRV